MASVAKSAEERVCLALCDVSTGKGGCEQMSIGPARDVVLPRSASLSLSVCVCVCVCVCVYVCVVFSLLAKRDSLYNVQHIGPSDVTKGTKDRQGSGEPECACLRSAVTLTPP